MASHKGPKVLSQRLLEVRVLRARRPPGVVVVVSDDGVDHHAHLVGLLADLGVVVHQDAAPFFL